VTDQYNAPLRPRDQPEQQAEPESRGDGMACPECGAELESMNHRRKHAEFHYPDEVFPPFASFDLAAERKAALLDVDPTTLRGTPRRRF
jgi:hypothetical protein